MAGGSKLVTGIVGLAFLGGIAHACGPDQPSTTPAATGSAARTTSPGTVPAATTASPVSSPITAVDLPNPGTATRAHVTRVVDGDTFEVTGGQRVRVLGIDSCEAGTYGGRQATDTARSILADQDVWLTTQPGVDRDRYGRQLRYVGTSYGTDYAQSMVGYDHTGVYAGRNDAAPGYVATLRAADTTGRRCSAPSPVATAPSTSVDVHLPRHHRDHGLPDGALTGGFCARHRWC